jgi:hypothetical protein
MGFRFVFKNIYRPVFRIEMQDDFFLFFSHSVFFARCFTAFSHGVSRFCICKNMHECC